MNKEVAINNITFIQKGTQIKGNIESTGKVHISGSLIGNINAKTHLVLNQEGKVDGDIITPRSEISGEVHGNLRISDLLVLKSTARIFGSVYSKFLVTEEGSQVNGSMLTGKDIDVMKEHHSQEKHLTIPQRKAG
ncbi:MAG: polymer-forming cytoskeletal protein [Balneolaceae bacterium]